MTYENLGDGPTTCQLQLGIVRAGDWMNWDWMTGDWMRQTDDSILPPSDGPLGAPSAGRLKSSPVCASANATVGDIDA